MDFQLANIDQWWYWLLVLSAVLLPGLIYGRLRYNQRRLQKIFGEPMYSKLTLSLDKKRRFWRRALMTAGIWAAVLAAGRPQGGDGEPSLAEQTSVREIALVFDVSLSMMAEDVEPTRLAAAKEIAGYLVESMPGERFALIAFAGAAFAELPLTDDQQSILTVLEELSPASIPVQGTDIEAGLQSGRRVLESTEGDRARALVLFSDGEELQGNGRQAAAELARAGITLLAVGMGESEHQVPVRDVNGEALTDDRGEVIYTALDEEFLRQLTSISEGIYYRGAEPEPTAEVLRRELMRLEQEPMGDEDWGLNGSRAAQELYQWPLMLAVLALTASMFIDERRRQISSSSRAFLAAAIFAIIVPGVFLRGDMAARNHRGHHFSEKSTTAALTDLVSRFDLSRVTRYLQRGFRSEEEKKQTALESFHLGRQQQMAGELEQAQLTYQRMVKHSSAIPELQGLGLWSLGLAEHQMARRRISEAADPEKVADLFESAVHNYIEAMRRLDSDPRLAYNYEVLRREQSAWQKHLRSVRDPEGRVDVEAAEFELEDLLPVPEEEEVDDPETLEGIDNAYFPLEQAEVPTEEPEDADELEEPPEVPDEPPSAEFTDAVEGPALDDRELSDEEVEEVMERARAREKSFREVVKQIKFRDKVAPEKQW